MIKRYVAAATAAITLLSVPLATEPAEAYNKANAAAYADSWATRRNYPEYQAYNDDCTNFVSQAIRAGGFSDVGENKSGDDFWWEHYVDLATGNPSWQNSHSWSVALDLYTFLYRHSPGGSREGSAVGASTSYWTPTNMTSGDVLFYNWTGGGIEHSAMQVGYGKDPHSAYSGNYVDQHTSDRYHAFWSLRPYNSQWATTSISFMHILSNNY